MYTHVRKRKAVHVHVLKIVHVHHDKLGEHIVANRPGMAGTVPEVSRLRQYPGIYTHLALPLS